MKNTWPIIALAFILLTGFTGSNGNQTQPEVQYKLLADVTDGTDDTYAYYVDMKYFSNVGIQLDLDGGTGDITATIEATLQDDGTVRGSCAYVDVTEAVFGAATFTADAMLLDDTGALALARYVKVKILAASTDNDADWTVRARIRQ